MSYFTPKPSTAQRGRPKGSGKIKDPEEKSTIPAKISPELYNIVQAERQFNESLSDTTLRLLRESRHKYIKERKKVDALE
jgi:hypothetical protein